MNKLRFSGENFASVPKDNYFGTGKALVLAPRCPPDSTSALSLTYLTFTQATLYMLDSEDLDSAMVDAGRQARPRVQNRQSDAEAEQRKRVKQPDRAGRNTDVGGNVGHDEQATSHLQDEDGQPIVEYEGQENGTRTFRSTFLQEFRAP